MERHYNASGSAFDDLADQIGQMMNEMRSRPFFKFAAGRGWQPSLNLYEIEEYYIICVALAGMNETDFDVRTEDRVVYISGQRPPPQLPQELDANTPSNALRDCHVHLMEIESGAFRREVEIPGDVDIKGISANYRHGYLWITMPKSPAVQADGDGS